MANVTIQELRELSRRSRRAHRLAFLALLGMLVLVPAQLVAARWSPEWAALGALTIGGALLVWWGYVAGEERGAFRRVFKRVADDRRAAKKSEGAEALPRPQPSSL